VAATGTAGAQSSPAPEVLEVLGEVVTAPAPLPRTGSDLGLAYVGAGLAGVGVVLVVAARRRQSSSSS
jgi:LPXTG-motif cell wall-anchored protein